MQWCLVILLVCLIMARSEYTFTYMAGWNLTRLREVRKQLRNELSEEIHKRDAIRAEIMFLQSEIAKYHREEQ